MVTLPKDHHLPTFRRICWLMMEMIWIPVRFLMVLNNIVLCSVDSDGIVQVTQPITITIILLRDLIVHVYASFIIIA